MGANGSANTAHRMAEPASSGTFLPRLRGDVDCFPSPQPSYPGWILRDPMGYATAALRVPAELIPVLARLDGRHGLLDCQAEISRQNGEIVPAEVITDTVAMLRDAGFLLTPEFIALRHQREAAFAAAPLRAAAFAGGGYPEDPGELRQTLTDYVASAADPPPESGIGGPLMGLAAPHVSPWGGIGGYAAAYRLLPSDLEGKTLAILGTSHHGAPDRFGLTRKPFLTPLGRLETDLEAVDYLFAHAGEVCIAEDYCHAIEHTIEFQCIFAQAGGAGTGTKILPVLCGPMLAPERGSDRFYAALGALAARRGQNWFWLLGVDLAHMGLRYGGAEAVQAGDASARAIEQRDRERLAAVTAGDAAGFRRLAGGDIAGYSSSLHWCGVSALYAFLRAMPHARGQLLHYGQWNIDEGSIVSYAAIAWRQPGEPE